MSRLGLLDTIELGITLVFVIPLVVFGIEKLFAGEFLFGAFGLGTAAVMLLIRQFLWTIDDLPGDVAKGVTNRLLIEDEESNEQDRNSD